MSQQEKNVSERFAMASDHPPEGARILERLLLDVVSAAWRAKFF
jgi:hypothetical protein